MRKDSSERQEDFDKKIAIEDLHLQKYVDWKFKNGETVYTQAESTFCNFDAYMQSGSSESIVEVKVRSQYTSEQIERWGGSFLEFKKLTQIISTLEKKNLEFDEFYYFCFFSDKLNIYKLPLDPTRYGWKLEYLQKDGYTKKKIWKHVEKLDNTFLVEEITF
jgi:hypothetical protein